MSVVHGQPQIVKQLRNDYGAPLSRRRVYVITVRRDMMIALDEPFDEFMRRKLRELRQPAQVRWQLDYARFGPCWTLKEFVCVHGSKARFATP